ncbi:MAG: class 1 fructose-bisphosphatase, partial [Planctomycetota bacterium]
MEPHRETLIHHAFRAQESHPGARGDFSALLTQIASACKVIGAECRRAGLGSGQGGSGIVGHHGDEVVRLDAFANDALTHAFDHTGLAAAMVTEEMEEVYIPAGPDSKTAEYIVCFDPIDGSSNVDVAVTVGTIFSIRKRRDPWEAPKIDDLLTPGSDLLASGYVLYGPSMVM